jgi:hypothetical protein
MKNKQRQGQKQVQKQVPFGDDNKKSSGKSKYRSRSPVGN